METLSRHGVRPSRKAGWLGWAAWGQPLPLQIAPPAGPMNLASEALVVLIPGLYRLWLPGSPQHPAFQGGCWGRGTLCESSPERRQWRKGSALARKLRLQDGFSEGLGLSKVRQMALCREEVTIPLGGGGPLG